MSVEPHILSNAGALTGTGQLITYMDQFQSVSIELLAFALSRHGKVIPLLHFPHEPLARAVINLFIGSRYY